MRRFAILAVLMAGCASADSGGVDETEATQASNEALSTPAPPHVSPTLFSPRAPTPQVTTGNGIGYHNGPIIANPTVYYIWYGSWTNNSAPTVLTDLVSHLGGTPYFNLNSTYDDTTGRSVRNAVTYGGSTSYGYTHGTSLDDAAVQTIVSDAISSRALPLDANGIYFVLTSSDVAESTGFCSSYCGWHTHATISSTDIKYAFVGNADRCPTACIPSENRTTSPNGNAGADAMANHITHEIDEAVTDPDLNAWNSGLSSENGDLCAWRFGTEYSASNGGKANMRLGTRDFLIQQNWVNRSGGYCGLGVGLHEVFRSADSHLHELYNNGSQWVNNDLTAFLGGAGPVGDPSGYILGNTQHIVFRSADSHMHELYNDATRWVNNDLTAFLGGAGPAGDPSGYVLGNTQHIVFRSADSHMHELYNNGAQWVNNDLTAFLGGAGPAGDPSGYVLGNTQHIVFRSADSHLHELYNNGTQWANNDLTAYLGGAGPAGDPSGYVLGNTQHIVFRGTDGHAHELYNNGTQWANNDLTAYLGGVGPAGEPSGYILGSTQHIVFRGTDGHVHELYNDSVRWVNNDLTAYLGGAAPAANGSGEPMGYVSNGTSHIVFGASNGRAHDYFNDGRVWSDVDMSTTAGGALPAGAVAGYVSNLTSR